MDLDGVPYSPALIAALALFNFNEEYIGTVRVRERVRELMEKTSVQE